MSESSESSEHGNEALLCCLENPGEATIKIILEEVKISSPLSDEPLQFFMKTSLKGARSCVMLPDVAVSQFHNPKAGKDQEISYGSAWTMLSGSEIVDKMKSDQAPLMFSYYDPRSPHWILGVLTPGSFVFYDSLPEEKVDVQ